MLEKIAKIIREAETFIITAGAGMGVDSGLPDFRGNHGFWQAYPPYAKMGISFVEAANPSHFQRDSSFAWGFYGHRTNLYRDTIPHEGFRIIRNWIESNNAAHFIVTSNVDGQFQKAGFPEAKILEVHGSIHWLQCLRPCCNAIWSNNEDIQVDQDSMRARSIPKCPHCHEVSRPNILMFNDCSWLSQRTDTQEERFENFLEEHQSKRIAVIEIGAGTAIPTIRAMSERIGWNYQEATVIRINPREAEIKPPHISLACAAMEGLQKIDKLINIFE